MQAPRHLRNRIGVSPAALIGGAVCMLALPSAVLAFTARFEPPGDNLAESPGMGSFTPASVDPRLARQIAVSSLPKGQVFRFTPAGISTRSDRSVTVAVRVDTATARAVNVRKLPGEAPVAASIAPLRIAPTAYSLGVGRGTQAFTLPLEIRRIDMPDLASFNSGSGAKDAPSRFNSRLALDSREKAGRAPRTFESTGDQTVDLSGSYRVGRNLDVTAGVRYSQDRDRLLPLTDGRQDNQAVYVGTQFHF
jgi:hypothetical protein